MIVFKHRGNFNKIERFFNNAKRLKFRNILEKYARQGVSALAENTPKDTGETAYSWNYEIVTTNWGYKISFTNSNIVDGVPVAILIQYGHGTGNGAYVEGRDYINPAIQPIFDKLSEELWKEVTRV